MEKIAPFLKLYRKNNLSFFPVPFRSKVAEMEWKDFQKRRPTEEEIQEWENGPETNIAVICGSISENLVVLDCDSIDRFHELTKIICQQTGITDILDFTTISKTGKGMHIWLKTKEPVKSQKFPKLDIKGEGGYIIAPPSIHPSGVEYQFVNETPIRTIELLTDIGIDIKQKSAEMPHNEPGWVSQLLTGVKEGYRNDSAIKLAGYFRNTQSQDITERILLDWNAKNTPPLSEAVVLRTIKSAYNLPEHQDNFGTSSGQDVDILAHKHLMPKPTVEERIQGQRYKFTWPEHGIAINVGNTRIHQRDNRVTGEITVETIDGEGKSILIYPPTQLNFGAARSRKELANSLSAKLKTVPWGEIIDQLAYDIQDEMRKGEPVRELWTHEKIPAPQFLLEPILYKGLPTIIFGEKAVCKSTLALVVYTCLILPWVDNPFGWVAPSQPVITLLADYEVDYNIAQYNAKRIQVGMGLPSFPIYYRRCSLPLADDLEQLQRHIADIKAEVIIVDSLGPAVGGEMKDSGIALRFNMALRQLQCASLIIGQTSKDRESKQKSTFGSAYFEYYARNIFELRKVQEEGEDELDIALFQTYCNLGRKLPAQGYRLHFNQSQTTMERIPITAPELIKRIGTQAEILSLLKSGAMTTKDIMDNLEITRGNADMALKRLRDKKQIIKVEDKWGLPAGGLTGI